MTAISTILLLVLMVSPNGANAIWKHGQRKKVPSQKVAAPNLFSLANKLHLQVKSNFREI